MSAASSELEPPPGREPPKVPKSKPARRKKAPKATKATDLPPEPAVPLFKIGKYDVCIGCFYGSLKGNEHEVYCRCTPSKVVKPESKKSHTLANWYSHQKVCELITKVKPGWNLQLLCPQKPAGPPPMVEEPEVFAIVTKKVLPGAFTSKEPPNPHSLHLRIDLPEEVKCQGLHGDGYREYAYQMGDSSLGGVGATAWLRFAPQLFPYKMWSRNGVSEDAASSYASDTEPAEPVDEILSEKRNRWTEYEKRRLHQSLQLAARWIIHSNSGSIFAKGCHRVTANRDGTCSACIAIGCSEGLKRGVRRALALAQLPLDDFTKRIKKRLAFTPLIRSEHAAVTAKANLGTPAVMKILSSKAKYGPAGVFLGLYQTVTARRSRRPGNFHCDRGAALGQGHTKKKIQRARQYTEFATMKPSPIQFNGWNDWRNFSTRRVAKSAVRLISPDLCPENLFAALDFAKLMNYDGPWICGGDATKLRPLLTTSTEFSEKSSAHVVGSTLPIRNVLFTSSEEQSRIILEIEAKKAIATQVHVIGMKIPLPGMPVFPVRFQATKGKVKAEELRDIQLEFRSLCGKAGIKLLASSADGASSETKAQRLLMNAKTAERLSYLNPKFGVFLSCPVYPDTGPYICTTDPDHARKTARNNFL
ncbi:hypothetical protein B0H14DRAFT_2568615 [Mycena olivaceomarginata]|nr:hypothetical protein B0H14DRAFT_2568615 [Mycena olivaceomarginata]